MKINSKIQLSIVIPCYKTNIGIVALVNEIKAALGNNLHYELILVNDGSPDETWKYIEDVCLRNNNFIGLNLSKNFGQHNALLFGILESKGKFIVTMDDDLQNPPSEILKLYRFISQNEYDIVYGVPEKEKHGIVRNFLSVFLKFFFELIFKINHISDTSSFRIFNSYLTNAFRHYNGKSVDIDSLLMWGTNNIGTLTVEHLERQFGKSNYNYIKLISYAKKMLISMSTKPLRLITIIGVSVSFFGFLILCYILFGYLFLDRQVLEFTFISSLITIFSGTILLCIGIIGEYLAHIYFRQMGMPYAVLKKRISKENNND